MIIKNITIENYLCYYGVKEFNLSDGLNIILGENGEGKTKFYEALNWLLNSKINLRKESERLDLLVSAKKLSEVEVTETFNVSVSITVNQFDLTKFIKKSFKVTKIGDGKLATSGLQCSGLEENPQGERINREDGENLLDEIFPFQIRRYSMFKGESELDIFKNEDSLFNLIKHFSDTKYYEDYLAKIDSIYKYSETAIKTDSNKSEASKLRYKILEKELKNLEQDKISTISFLNDLETEIKNLKDNTLEIEKHISNADSLNEINSAISSFEAEIKNLTYDENITKMLFDEFWILRDFEPILKEFSSKINEFSIEKRKLQKEFDMDRGAKEAENKLINDSLPLPLGVPSPNILEEMLRDEICKVCNRPAEKGSIAYDYIKKRINDYITGQKKININNNDDLFKNNYLNKLEFLRNLHEENLFNIFKIKDNIKERFNFISTIKINRKIIQTKIDEEISKRDKLISSSDINSESLVSVFKNYSNWKIDLNSKENSFNEYRLTLEKIETKLQEKIHELENIDNLTVNPQLLKVREILRDIQIIFRDTKEKKLEEFIIKLEKKSNSIFSEINIDSFTGNIKFNRIVQGGKNIINIELREGQGLLHNPNQSLLTSMHISILFAISEIASKDIKESFPMIFDAPTSSFGESKSIQFLNLINSTSNQKILLIKDFIKPDRSNKKLVIKDEFERVKRNKAFWIKLKRPFDANELISLNTEVVEL